MYRKLTPIVLLAAVTAVSSNVLADDDIQLVIPMPPPASRPSDGDVNAVRDAQSVFIAAQREADAADAEYVRAQGEWKRVARQLRWELEVSRDMVRAKEAVNGAKAAYETATKPVLASLGRRADYREACDALTRAQQSAAAAASHGGARFEQRVAAAQAVLDCKAAVTRLENEAFEGDAGVVNARRRRAASVAHLRDVRARLQRALQQDPSYVAASQALQDAQDRTIAADRQLAAAKLQLSAALNLVADKQIARQEVSDWARQHGLPEPP
jgi:hypothetical protein